MTPDDFKRKLGFFRQNALQGRNLFLWLAGGSAPLRLLLADGAEWIGVPSLLPQTGDLTGDASIRRALESELRGRLGAAAGRRRIVVLSEPGLIARYVPGLTLLYEYVDGSQMAVIVAEPLKTTVLPSIPPGLQLDHNRVVNYFRQRIPPEYVIEEVTR